MNAKTKQIKQGNSAEAYLKAVRTSPLKLRKVTRAITGMPVEKALMYLTFCKMRISKNVKALLKSAMANAENNKGMDIDNLIVERIDVGRAFVMKRFRPRAKGRGCRILKPFSKIRIILTEKRE
jgi:large subunit ribosomal protein L22